MPPAIDPATSRLFNALRAVLMLAVVAIHSEKGVVYGLGGETPGARAFFEVVCRHLFQTAVPLYFAISGYLLFLRPMEGPRQYRSLAVKRFRTIMLPFLLVNGFWLAWLTIFGSIPGISGTTILRQRGYLDMLLGLDGLPLIYTLWFLRDLFLFVLAAPLFGFFLRRLPYTGLAAIWLCWNFMLQQGIPLEFSGAFFFYLGGLLAVKRLPLTAPRPALAAAWVVFAACVAASAAITLTGTESAWKFPIWRMSILAGVVCVWHLALRTRIGERAWPHALAPWIFFIYLLHEPVLSYLSDWTKGLPIPETAPAQIAYAAALTAATVGVTFALGWLFKRLAPAAYSVLTGGR